MLTQSLILKRLLQFGGLFLVGDGLYHLSGLKMQGIVDWPQDAHIYFQFFQFLWGCASTIIGVLVIQLSLDIKRHLQILLTLAMVGLSISAVLFWFSFMQLETITNNHALHLWHPYYSWQIRIEASYLIGVALLVFKTAAKNGIKPFWLASQTT